MLISNALRVLLLVALLASGSARRASALPTSAFSELASHSASSDAAAPRRRTAPVDHHLLDSLLQRHVLNGFVDYEAFARSPAFPRYLASLDGVRLDGQSEDEQLAFWINVYNAFTIQLIISHRETESVRNINKSLGVLRLKGPWSEPLVRAAGRRLSLDDVFHGILRRQFAEPRIHFAVSCAAIGCAPLRSEAYTGDKLVDQLNDQGRLFLRESPTRNQIDRARVRVSPILMAYRTDFGVTRRDLMRSIAPWFDGEERKRLTAGSYVMIQNDFDWTLNSQLQARRLGLL